MLGIRAHLPALAALLGIASVGLGCPARVETGGRKAPPQAGEDDPRVIRDSGDLYAVDSPGVPDPDPLAEEPAELTQPRGVGKPDERNGVCRLFAPEYPNPACCQQEYGLDAARTAELCGHEHFLGEHVRGDCGYYFLPKAGESHTWIRIGFIAGESAKAASDERDEFIRRRFKLDGFGSEPVPGVSGAYWTEHEGVRWAHLPGWSKVRRVTWDPEFCSDEAMAKVLGELVSAKEPPEGAERNALVPTARR